MLFFQGGLEGPLSRACLSAEGGRAAVDSANWMAPVTGWACVPASPKGVKPKGAVCRVALKVCPGDRQPELLSRTPKQAPGSLLAPQNSP